MEGGEKTFIWLRGLRAPPVVPWAATLLRARQMSTLRSGSVPTVGSSRTRSRGEWTIAQPRDNLRCCPPLSWVTCLSAWISASECWVRTLNNQNFSLYLTTWETPGQLTSAVSSGQPGPRPEWRSKGESLRPRSSCGGRETGACSPGQVRARLHHNWLTPGHCLASTGPVPAGNQVNSKWVN